MTGDMDGAWVIVLYTKTGTYRQILKDGKEIESTLHECLYLVFHLHVKVKVIIFRRVFPDASIEKSSSNPI